MVGPCLPGGFLLRGLGAACPCEAQSYWLSNQRKGHFVFETLGKLREKEAGARLRLPALPPCFLTKCWILSETQLLFQ